MTGQLLLRLLAPKDWRASALIGGGAAVAGDLISFFTEMASPIWFAALFGVGVLVFGVLCGRKALGLAEATGPEADAVVECRECDGFRFSLFAAAVFLILALIGQGESATARIGTQLGVIEEDVRVTREGVENVQEALAATMVVDDPDTAPEHFNNAWIYLRQRNDAAAALREMEDLYARFAPKKIDAAELYAEAARASMSREALTARMIELGRARRDETLLIVAARQLDSAEARRAVVEEARAIDPGQPFAWFDSGQYERAIGEARGSRGMEDAMREQLALLDQALPLFEGRSAGDFYYRPQYAADPRQMAEMYRGNLESQIDSFSQLNRMAGR